LSAASHDALRAHAPPLPLLELAEVPLLVELVEVPLLVELAETPLPVELLESALPMELAEPLLVLSCSPTLLVEERPALEPAVVELAVVELAVVELPELHAAPATSAAAPNVIEEKNHRVRCMLVRVLPCGDGRKHEGAQIHSLRGGLASLRHLDEPAPTLSLESTAEAAWCRLRPTHPRVESDR
jgi:hypothetical protein